MSASKLLRLDEEHPELRGLFGAARAQEPAPDTLDRMVHAVRHSVVKAALLETAFERRPTKHLWETRAAVVIGALGFAAGAFAAVGVRYISDHSARVVVPAGIAESATNHDRAAPVHQQGRIAPPSTTNAPDAAASARWTSPTRTSPKHLSNKPPRALGLPATQALEPVPQNENVERNSGSGVENATASIRRPVAVSCPSRERATIDQARDALAHGEPTVTLATLNTFEQACRFKAFAPEALQLRMKAQAGSGRMSAAIETAQRLSEQFPNTAPGQDALHFLDAQRH